MDEMFFAVIPWAFAALFLLLLVFSMAFTVRTQTATLIERFGKFNRVAGPGLHFKIPFVEARREINLVTMQLTGSIETKTLDNVFVELPVTVQYRVIDTPTSIRDAYYRLSTPKAQIESYLYNILLGHIPETSLDNLFLSQPKIALRATQELSQEMAPFGYEIVKVLITDIIPDEGVKTAMNRINEETRNAVANQAQGDAEYVLRVRQAEAQAEVLRLSGVGVALERQAIADGWAKSIADLRERTSMTDVDATFVLLFTNYTAMLADVGQSKNSTTIFMPSGPEGLRQFQQAMTNGLLSDLKTQGEPKERGVVSGKKA